MADELMLEIVTPERVLFSGNIEEVTIPGTEGEFGVLLGHASLLSSLKFGELNYTKDGRKSFYAVNTGYAEVTGKKVTILVESAEKSDMIDVDRAKRAREIAEQKLDKLSKDDPEYDKVKGALDRAEARLKIAEKK
ncbi:MAG TPA: F0F1 ATP synthase subunit epsilon [Syntrophales bacterium]|nr:F0F1 ATP synthase subunit epsilon [Syntrophales bacterium]